MTNKKLSEGVGKKIVEALKKQSEIEIHAIPASKQEDELESIVEELPESFIVEDNSDYMNFEKSEVESNDEFLQENDMSDLDTFFTAPIKSSFTPEPQKTNIANDSFIRELDTFEIPSNIAVLKKLISQLPSGVTKHTGAQIIKQTMEALGISMKSVLQEAQQVQDGLSNSAKECHSTIQEYKKQIITLEKQAQNHQRQYNALNDLISLFIQTGV